jgi:molybdate transport system substrate-binding protein
MKCTSSRTIPLLSQEGWREAPGWFLGEPARLATLGTPNLGGEFFRRAILIVLFLLVAIPGYAEDINVVAASDLNFAIKEIVQQFEMKTGNTVHLTLGSSGNFSAQITNGAPFDVFLSADVNYAKQVEAAGRGVPGSTFIYAVGGLALWVPKGSTIRLDALGMKSLLEPSVKKIAIANPEHAPYGRAAVAAMQKAGVYDSVKTKLVLGENISQAAQFVQSHAADIGIIALSIATSDPMRRAGTYWTIPRETFPPIEQAAVLLKHGGPAAKAFHEFLRSAAARAIFEKYGFRR